MSQPAFPGSLSPGDPDLTERQRQVFAALVRLYESSARPVGSELLAQHQGLGISSASIRQTLGELESLGLLGRSHSSAGRVPSAGGYELFVRMLLPPAVLAPELIAEIDWTLTRSTRDVDHLLSEASRLLSSLTHQLGLAVAASLDGETLSRLDLDPLDERRVLMVMDLGGGAVRTLVLELESPLDRDELEEVADVLRDRLIGLTLSEVRERFAEDDELVRKSAVRIVALAAAQCWARAVSTPLFSAGAAHMAEHPEFSSSIQLGSILRVVEAGSPLDRLMVAGIEGQVAVRVGLDEDRALAGCSLVNYPLPGTVRGAVAVLGPLRMNYSHALAVVDVVGARVADLLGS